MRFALALAVLTMALPANAVPRMADLGTDDPAIVTVNVPVTEGIVGHNFAFVVFVGGPGALVVNGAGLTWLYVGTVICDVAPILMDLYVADGETDGTDVVLDASHGPGLVLSYSIVNVYPLDVGADGIYDAFGDWDLAAPATLTVALAFAPTPDRHYFPMLAGFCPGDGGGAAVGTGYTEVTRCDGIITQTAPLYLPDASADFTAAAGAGGICIALNPNDNTQDWPKR